MSKTFVPMRLLLTCFSLFLTIRLSAQLTKVDNLNSQEFSRIVPASPTVSALGKYGDWPVSYATGTPSISIPIYEIKMGKLSLPVNLSYHASGIKVEEVPSWTGAGWSLNAGGAISRTVFGAMDENTFFYPNLKGANMPASFDVVNNDSHYDYFTKVIGELGIGQYDAEPDIYFFNFAGHSGKAYMDENGSFHFIPRKNLKINVHAITTQPRDQQYWEVVDESGVTYILGQNVTMETAVTTIYPPPLYAPTPYHAGPVTAWYLNKMISADKADTIHFEYVNKLEAYVKKAEQSYKVPLSQYSPNSLLQYGYGNNTNVTSGIKVGDNNVSYTGKAQISRIYWRNGEVKFIPGGNRADISGVVLDRIEIYNAAAQKIKSFQLSYINDPKRLFLEKVTETGKDGSVLPPHQFAYTPGLPDRYSDSQDYWGYFNNANNSHLLPFENELEKFYLTGALGALPNANREPSDDYMKAGTLEKITYPTGGYTLFDFEANRYYKTGNAQTLTSVNEPGVLTYPTVTLEALDQTQFPAPYNPRVKEVYLYKSEVMSFSIDFRNYRKGAWERDSWLPKFKIQRVLNDGSVQDIVVKDAFNNWDEATKDFSDATALGVVHLHIDIYNQLLQPGLYRFVTDLTCGRPGGDCGQAIPASSAKAVFACQYYTPPSSTVENSRLCGGLRIKKISNYSSNGALANEKSFEYTETTAGEQPVIISTGKLLSKPKFASMSYQPYSNGTSNGCEECLHVMSCTVTTHDLSINGLSQGPHIGYNKVREIFSGRENGYKEYEFTTFDDEFNDPTFDYSLFGYFGRPVFLPTTSNEFKRGLLLKETTYKKSGASQFLPVSQVINEYNYGDSLTDNSYHLMKVLKIARAADRLGLAICYGITGNCGPIYLDAEKVQFRSKEFATGYYNLKSAWVRLTRKTELSYDINGANPLQLVTQYNYANPTHMQITRTEATNSKGEKVTTSTKYPLDFSGVTASDNISAGITNLQLKNVLNAPLETTTYKSNSDGTGQRMIASKFTGYKSIDPAVDKMYEIDNAAGLSNFVQSNVTGGAIAIDSRYNAKLSYNNYDAIYKLPIEVQKVEDKKQSFLWGYRGLYPIANVDNADVAQIAYTSFEGDASGTWAIPGSPRNTQYFHTGAYSYALADGSVSRSSLSTSKVYLLSFWFKSDMPQPVVSVSAGGSSVDQNKDRIVNGWKFKEYKLTNATSVQLTQGSGNCLVDELRVHPIEALMVSYTFDPLVGMTSQTDANSRTTYYEFDNFGRLELVRDQYRNILKKYCYSYSGQVVPCTYDITPKWQTTGETRCKPCDANPNYITNILQNRERDVNPQSPTYNQLRWVDGGASATCVVNADWQNTATAVRCKKNGSNQNTGEQEQEQRDMNPCSSTYNQTRWVVIGTNTTACPLPVQTIYAKITYNNLIDDGLTSSANYYINFYSNSNCTSSVSVSNLTVNYKRDWNYCDGTKGTTYNYSVVCNGNQMSLGRLTQSQHDGQHCWNFVFTVTAGTGYLVCGMPID